MTKQQCAFIQFTTRTAAELAAEKAFNKLILCGRRLTIKWGRSQAKISSSGVKESETKNLEPVPGLPDGKYFFLFNHYQYCCLCWQLMSVFSIRGCP